jgi:hypothetical protein
MAKANYLGLVFAAEWAIAVTLGADTYAQVAGPSPSLNLPGVTEQGGPLPQIVVTGYLIPRVGGRPAAGHDFGPGFYLQTGRSKRC